MPVGARKKPYLKRQSELLRIPSQSAIESSVKAKPTFFKFSSAVVNTVFSFEKTNQRTKMYKIEVHQLFRIKYTVKCFALHHVVFYAFCSITHVLHFLFFSVELYLAVAWLFYDNLERRSITTSLEDFFMSLSSSANSFFLQLLFQFFQLFCRYNFL